MNGNARVVNTVKTCYNDVDINGHVNSIKYIEHILDLFNMQWYREHWLKRFEIAYVAESYFGDTLSFYMENLAEKDFCISVRKSNPDINDEKEVEVCRSLLKFVKD